MGDSCSNSKRVKLRDGRFLAYVEEGVPKEEAKHKIIIVHGFGCSKNMNFPASKELIEELGVYFLIHDRSGYGESDSKAKRSVKSEVDDIAELADQLEIGPKFYLIGISMGSYPAWGCLKHIPHRLSGVAFVAPTVNYQWPSLPEKLIKKDYRRVFIKWCLWISEHAPGLLHYWLIQMLFLTTITIIKGAAFYFNSHDLDVLERPTGFPMVKDKQQLKIVFDTIRDDFVACFEKWDFEPADISISEESSVHIWHGKEDKLVPAQLQRCILEKQPLINYHEVPDGGHLIGVYNGICDAVLYALLLGEVRKSL
ncbi:unnamed protein product [Arabis nemorensis]|uniref:Serine aminopeptidase S33 domain-containing protein n=1 Tax=Arabis nemorensis TaxID=586526 RepID=A0A565AN89_9BRAS|nr:unnamed protein product [Arabis nemorensis]